MGTKFSDQNPGQAGFGASAQEGGQEIRKQRKGWETELGQRSRGREADEGGGHEEEGGSGVVNLRALSSTVGSPYTLPSIKMAATTSVYRAAMRDGLYHWIWGFGAEVE